MASKPKIPPDDIKAELLAREVAEEVRREQIEKLWKAYSVYIIGAAALIVVGVGGWQVAKARAIAAAEAAGALFEESLRLAEAGKLSEAETAFSRLASDTRGGYAALARLHVASAQAKAGRTKEAVAEFEALAEDCRSDPLIRDFAGLQAATLRLDAADWTEMQSWLTPLTVDRGPWRFSARELLGLAALKAGKIDEARDSIQGLVADPKAPATARQRAQILMEQIVARTLAAATNAGTPAEPARTNP